MPTQGYIALSDSKQLDSQAGLETGMGAALAALSGINSISGPGMLDFESCFSLEKLAVDNEICGMAYRLIQGIAQRDEPLAVDLFEGFTSTTQFLTMPHTRKWYRVEHTFPTVTDRETYDGWAALGKKNIAERASEIISSVKITRAISRIALGLQDCLYLGNLAALRDWGHARDYVHAQWLMLQQDSPEDFVIATGEAHSVREFLQEAFTHVELDWRDYVEIDPKKREHRAPQYLAVNPHGKVPAMVDGELTLFESGAIGLGEIAAFREGHDDIQRADAPYRGRSHLLGDLITANT